MFLCRASRHTRPAIPCAAGSPPRHFHQGSVGRNKLTSFVREGAQGSSNVAKHNKRKSPVQSWRPVSTEAVPQKDDITETSNSGSKKVIEDCITSSENLASDGKTNVVIEVITNDAPLSKNNSSFESSSTKVVIEDNVELSGFNKDLAGSNVSGTYSSSIEVDAPLIRFVKGKGGSTQKQIEEDTGVQIIFPSSREGTSVVLEGKSAESIRKASQMIANVLEEAVQSRQLDYSHFTSLPLVIHPDLVNKLNYFRSSILGEEGSDKDESRSEGSIDEMGDDRKQADGSSSVSIKLQVQEEESDEAKMGGKGSQSVVEQGSYSQGLRCAQSVSTQVNEALENQPISIQLRGLTCMKGSPAKARVVYAPVLEVSGEGRLAHACKVITDAFVKSGLVFEGDVRELKLHVTIMNVRHWKRRNKPNPWKFDARDIFRKFGKEEWGEYPIHEVHLSQRFKFDRSGYYYCCSSIPLPAEMHTE